jgi:peptide/nickel transport system permease protein
MRSYMVRRAAHSAFIILVLMTLIFFITHILGDPVQLMLPAEAPPEQLQALRKDLGYDRPLHIQFFSFSSNLARGDFGLSIRDRIPATDLVLERLPKTLLLGATAWAVGMIGLPLGILAARRPRSVYDRVVNVLSFAVVSVPEFWLALVLILVVAVKLDLLPTSGFGGYADLKYLVLPALTLSPRVIGRNAQITRAAMTEELGKQYVATARAKGLSEGTVLYVHVLKNAGISIVTLLGDELTFFLSGSAVVEVVFGWPGMGQLIITSIVQRDLPVVTACVFTLALIVILINLTVDLFYTWLDPRVQYR